MNNPYIAGFFDGEGHVQLRRTGNSVVLTIAQRRPAVLEAIRDFLGYGAIYYRRNGNISLQISGRSNVWDFIDRVLPYTVVKRDELLVAQRRLEKVKVYKKRLPKTGD